jgi:hypothetical protein
MGAGSKGARLVSNEKMASGSVGQAKKGGEVGLTCSEGKRKDMHHGGLPMQVQAGLVSYKKRGLASYEKKGRSATKKRG